MSSPAKLTRALDPIYVGATLKQPLQLFESDKTTPLDLTGKVLTLHLNRIGLPEKAVAIVGAGNAPGVVVFEAPPAETAEWLRGRYAVEVRMAADGDDLSILVGEVTVAKGAASGGEERIGAARTPWTPGIAVGGAAPMALAMSPQGPRGEPGPPGPSDAAQVAYDDSNTQLGASFVQLAIEKVYQAIATAFDAVVRLLGLRGGTVYISTVGDDANGGSNASTLRTFNAAVEKLGGRGQIFIEYGEYGEEMRIDPTKVENITIIGTTPRVARKYDFRPILRMAPKITGWTKVAGYNSVWVAPVANLPAWAGFHWAYLDGRVDPTTAIVTEQRHPEHRGRTHRLMTMCKLWRTTATTQAAACAEIDAGGATTPKAWPDTANGLLYRYGELGDDDNCYLDAAEGLVSLNGQTAATIATTCGRLKLIGLDVRYGGIDLRPFRKSVLEEVRALGARINVVVYSMLSFKRLEVGCGGSQDQNNGDGLNGSAGAKVSGADIYAHDSWDDGISDHGACSGRIDTGLTEYNGGAGVAPAAGSDVVYRHIMARYNQNWGRGDYKRSQFYVTNQPDANDGGGDAAGTLAGVDTNAVFINCISVGGSTGFADVPLTGTVTNNRANCYGCIALDYSVQGFDIGGQLVDCKAASATGTPRKANRGIVRALTLITGATSTT